MTTTFTGLPTASGIDPSNDWLGIDRTSLNTTQRINRNTLLGITGSPVGTTDSQSLTNKTIDNTNTITQKDTLFTLQDDGDTTKQARFQLSGITTGTTRTYTLPNRSDTLVDLGSTQTLTSKTLTSPTITGGTISQSAITVDSIAGFSSSTSGTIFGLPISSSKVGTNGVITGSITDSAVTSAKVANGIVVQVANTISSAVATGTTIIPEDDTIPQNTEGTEFMTCTITPKSATNVLVIEVTALMSNSSANQDHIVALFQDSTANALAAVVGSHNTTATAMSTTKLTHTLTAGTTSATTFKVRCGSQGAGTVTFNGQSGGRKFGAITKSAIVITEYKA